MELRDKIDTATCTVEELREFCATTFEERPGVIKQDANYFVEPDSMQAFTWLKNWWALPEYPRHLPEPNLLAFLWSIYIPEANPQPVTLNQRIMEFYQKAHAYCIEEGIDPQHPGETADERRKRRNRERMAKVRSNRRVPDHRIQDDSVRDLVRDLEAQIDALKAVAEGVDNMHKADVIAHQEAMIAASAARKEEAARYKQSIDELRAQIKQLTAKQ